MANSGNPALGVSLYPGGADVGVWAPDATGVVLRRIEPPGTDVALVAQPGGYWTGKVPGMTSGDVYTYVLTTPSAQLVRVDPRSQHALDTGADADATASIVYDESGFPWSQGAWTNPGWSDLVIYELHVGTFAPGPGEPVGTFDDVISKLGYLGDLGVNALELLPVVEFEGNVSWGYDPGVPFSVTSAYGGPDGLKKLVDAANDHGITVLLDVVYNHLGPPDSILWQFDGSGPGWESGIYFYGTRWPGDGRPQTPWGSRPDYGRPDVRQYFCDNAVQWLQSYRVGGLRFDATSYIRSIDGSGHADQDIPDGWLILQEINDAIDAAQDWKITIAEDMRGSTAVTSPTTSGGAGFDSQWDPNYLNTVRSVLEQVNDADRDMGALANAITNGYGPTVTGRVIFTESHDADGNGRTRVPTEIDPAQPDSWWSKKRSTLGAALTFTAPGIPMLFQGQEFLEQKPFLQQSTPPTWSNASTYAGILQLYKDLIALRRDIAGLTKGLQGDGLNIFHVNNTAKVLGYHRYASGGPGDDVIVLANFANTSYLSYTFGVPRPGTWNVRLNTDWDGYDPSYSNTPAFSTSAADEPLDGFAWSAGIGLGPYTALVLSQSP